MHKASTLGAIFSVFILCVHCDKAAIYNENRQFFVPSAPQNLTATAVTSVEIHLSWVPPSNYTQQLIPENPSNENIVQNSEPNLSVISKQETQSDEPLSGSENIISVPPKSEQLKNVAYTTSSRDWYKNDLKYNDPYSQSHILNDHSYKGKRDIRLHRHRKRRQDSNVTDIEKEHLPFETHEAIEFPIEVVKKSHTQARDISQVAYVLYYEEGVLGYGSTTVFAVQNSSEVKTKNVFPSDLGIDSLKSTKNLTLINVTGKMTRVVGFRLKNLKPFTPYKIWVRAFYNFSLEGVKSSDLLSKLGPSAEPLYVLTDVAPPSAPIILNLTCDQPKGLLYLHWRHPLEYNNSIDQYVVTLRKIPGLHPRKRLMFHASKNELEISIKEPVDLSNMTRYEVKIYAVTLSIWQPNTLYNGTETVEEVSSEWCMAHPEAMIPAMDQPSARDAVLFVVLPITILVAVAVGLLYWRCKSRLSKCISAAYSYLEEGGERAARAPLNTYKKPVVSCSPVRNSTEGGGCPDSEPALSSAPNPPRMAGSQHPAVRARDFPSHVAALHADGDIGFSKEYEIVVSKSAALGHTSHHSHRPENRLKNRYLNITAYDHSRVCVSAGGRCGAAGCVGGGGAAGGGQGACDYVNANFIDGMLPVLTEAQKRYIRKKIERRNKPIRQPSIKPGKPPPNLTEGIESAFLNIEFSGIVESDEQNSDSDSEKSDEDSELDDVYVDIDGVQTRVKLEWLIWRRRYIATQGPTPATLDAFWRMIWQHRVHTVVMITNLVERGRRKCDMYWPSGGLGSSAIYGGVRVTLLHEDVRAAYTVRHMRVLPASASLSANNGYNSNGSEVGSETSDDSTDGRIVVQYHYTVWPDHGTPRHPLAVLPFVRAASADPATVLVHCSAGVGRTGTYIVLDAQLNQLKLTGTLSPLGFLCRARTQRNHLVQTEEQYVFVHDALLEHVRSGNTEVEYDKAREYLLKLLEDIPEDELAVVDVNIKRSTLNEISNGIENCETLSIKSSQIECSDKGEAFENGSQLSSKTDDLNSELSKSAKELNTNDELQRESIVNGDETEAVYNLAPRLTDTYKKKMETYNNLSEHEKEEIRRVNRTENYAILERMRMLSGRQSSFVFPQPVNLLEKQFQLISRSCTEPSICARAPHNVEKNRPDGILPSDSARVMLVPKPGVEGSEYVNASWVSGRRRLREYAVAQHPVGESARDLWRLLWDHTAQLVLSLADTDDCEIFWPTENEKELFIANFKASFVSKETYVAHRKCEQKFTTPNSPEPEVNGYRRQESSDCADDERLIPENSSPLSDPEPSYKFDRTSLRLERLSSGSRDLSARKSIANGDLFSSLAEKKNGSKSPKSPTKMSLKNFKLSSPTKFKFPDWGTKTAGSPPDTAPPPPPIAPSLSVEEEIQLRRPCYLFEKVDNATENLPTDRIIEVTNVSVHSLQDDYQLSVKFIKCSGWLDGVTSDYELGKSETNEFIRAIRQAANESEREEALNRLIEPYKDSFSLVEFVAGCQMEYKNGPVVVVDKFGGWKAMSFCALSAACGGARDPAISDPAASFFNPAIERADLYCSWSLAAHARCPERTERNERNERAEAISPSALLACYCALASYGPLLHQRHTEHR